MLGGMRKGVVLSSILHTAIIVVFAFGIPSFITPPPDVVIPVELVILEEEVEIDEPIDLYSRFTGHAPQLADWLTGTSINRDHSLRLEYLAGLSRRIGTTASHIYLRLVALRSADSELFEVDADTLWSLWTTMPGGFRAGRGSDGEMIDRPHLKRAERLLARAGLARG